MTARPEPMRQRLWMPPCADEPLDELAPRRAARAQRLGFLRGPVATEHRTGPSEPVSLAVYRATKHLRRVAPELLTE